MKNTIKTISSWEELIKLVDSTNIYKQTIIMSGYLNQIEGERTSIKSLVFTTVPVEILNNIETGLDITVKVKGKKK